MSKKEEVISFKVDSFLAEQIRQIPNSSQFIRRAVLDALDNVCPLCQGKGVLDAHQQKHWDVFLASHHMEKCDECESVHVVCDSSTENGKG